MSQHPALHHPHTTDANRLGLALLITAAFMVLEVAGGLLTGSLALIADAGHMMTDTAALGLAWIAARLAGVRKPTDGSHDRGQVIAAFVNSVALLGVVAWILWEASRRLAEPREIEATAMLAIAALGLIANLAVLRVLAGGEGNLNVAAARLHVIGDLLGSIAACMAAIVILATGWTPIDPLLSVLVALLILRSAAALLGRTGRILFADRTDGRKPRGDEAG